MAHPTELDDAAIEAIARTFRALSEPLRLKILNHLREGERTVGELTSCFGCSQANISKHLSVLLEAGLVARRLQGTSAFYRFADASTYELCDIVCGQVGRRLEAGAALSAALQAVGRRG